ncbi:MAG: PorT family protein [Crocinitomicaceae bacterium]|nr:PorT family protein [Flavobacteriales bacterium]NQZ36896.1 PorT family protein [Crocinitomicaceae bacterium]
MRLILVLIVLTAVPVFGQNHYIGLRSGVSLSNVISEDLFNDRDFRTGFIGGLTYEYKFENKFSISIDLVYAQKGFSEDAIFNDETGSIIDLTHSTNFNYDYLSIPIKGGFSIGNNFQGFLNLGILPSMLVNAKTITSSIGIYGALNQDIAEYVDKFDLGGLLEIGGSYKFKERFLLFSSLTYQQSFTSITNDNYFSDWSIKHNGMTLSVGLKYALTAGV